MCCLSFCGAATGYEGDASKYHCGGKDFLPTEGVHAYINAYGYGDDGLHVGVHAHKGRTDALLTYGDEEVGDKGGANDEVSQL